MRNLTLALIGILTGGSLMSVVLAEQIDNTQTLPDAKPGECYAKVITPAEFETNSEEVVLQEASERLEIMEAEFETAEQAVMVKEGSENLVVSEAVFKSETERVEVRAAELAWTTRLGNQVIPAFLTR